MNPKGAVRGSLPIRQSNRQDNTVSRRTLSCKQLKHLTAVQRTKNCVLLCPNELRQSK
jgi:hypothetical protein